MYLSTSSAFLSTISIQVPRMILKTSASVESVRKHIEYVSFLSHSTAQENYSNRAFRSCNRASRARSSSRLPLSFSTASGFARSANCGLPS